MVGYGGGMAVGGLGWRDGRWGVVEGWQLVGWRDGGWGVVGWRDGRYWGRGMAGGEWWRDDSW